MKVNRSYDTVLGHFINCQKYIKIFVLKKFYSFITNTFNFNDTNELTLKTLFTQKNMLISSQ